MWGVLQFVILLGSEIDMPNLWVHWFLILRNLMEGSFKLMAKYKPRMCRYNLGHTKSLNERLDSGIQRSLEESNEHSTKGFKKSKMSDEHWEEIDLRGASEIR